VHGRGNVNTPCRVEGGIVGHFQCDASSASQEWDKNSLKNCKNSLRCAEQPHVSHVAWECLIAKIMAPENVR